MTVICSVSLERRYEDAIDVVFDMLGNSMSPDFLTYKTLLGGMWRDGRGDEAFQLLDELRKRDCSMGEKTYKILLNGLYFLVSGLFIQQSEVIEDLLRNTTSQA
jgi:pentatricopeptide repeat protein